MAERTRLGAAAAALRRTLLGLWLGAVACVAFVVAPTLFRVIRAAPEDRHSPAPNALAGDVVVQVLQQLAWLCLISMLAVAFLLYLETDRRRMVARLAALGVGAACAVLSMGWLTPTMLDLLGQMGGPVDALALDDPLRVAFGGLHKWSSSIHLGLLLSPLTLLVLEPYGAPPPGATDDHSTR